MKELYYFLGIEVILTLAGIMISQRHYILNLLYKFGMAECKSVATPLDRNLKLDADSGPTRVSRPSIGNSSGVSSTSRSLDPISAIRSVSLANSCKYRVIFTWIAQSEYYDM